MLERRRGGRARPARGASAVSRSAGPPRSGDAARLDRWLRFSPPILERYDEENSAKRVKELRSAILLGLGLYNVYNLTSLVLLPDIVLLSVVLRLAVVTPASLGLIWLIRRTGPRWTERVVTLGILNAYLVPVFLFWRSHDPNSLLTFGELPLTIIFADMLLALRFLNAVLFTVCALAVTLLAVATKTGVEAPLALALAVQIATACTFALYANYRQERRRCFDFLAKLAARLDAIDARADSLTYRKLSRTDALTQLPNRRHFTERMEGWLAERRPLAVLMLDIDHFKSYNDALGHPAGDDCLQRVADVFARVAGDSREAFCARLGGEEFAFVLPDAGELAAAQMARSILQAVVNARIAHPGRSDGVGIVTVSIGVALGDGAARRSLGELLQVADQALYQAKRQGRNGFSFGEADERVARAV